MSVRKRKDARAVERAKSNRGERISTPGPIIAAISQGVELDGLTIIPLVRLPPIKFHFAIPLTSRRVHVRISPSASEVVFKTLRIASFSTRALDACRDPIEVKVAGVDTDFSGSFSIKASLRIEGGEGTKDGWSCQWLGSGRVAARLTDSRLSLNAQLVQKGGTGPPKVEVLSTRIDEGVVHEAVITGFGVWGRVATTAIPFVKGTVFVRWPTKILGDYLSREILESPLVDSILADIFNVASEHVDMETYEALIDDERQDEIATPLDPKIHDPPSSHSPSPPSPSPSTSSIPPPDPSQPETAPPLAPPPPPPAQFRLHAHLVGPTRLHTFPLPDFSPELYRPGGTRSKLQSLNLLTSELQLNLTDIALARLTFARGSLAFDPPSNSTSGLGGGDVIVSVEDLTVLMAGDFVLGADTSSVVAWTTGIKRLKSSGTSTTTVLARSLQLRFKLARSSHSSSAYELRQASISPFTSITPAFQLDNAVLDLGADFVNAVTKKLATQIAQAVSLVLGAFFKDAVRQHLQGLMVGVEERLREAGVELPSGLRREDVDD
ncbi:hypothetical protein RQP46_003923 [Phenoliferia psychrophenolica]